MVRLKSWRFGLTAALLGLALMCPVVASAAEAVDEQPSFTKDIAPIFRDKCEACHRPGYIAPMSLQTYAEVRPWARSIKQRVESRQMPPWHIDKAVGVQSFKNDRSMTDAEIETVVRWVDNGAPQGNPSDLPPAAVFADDDVWNYADFFGGPPDVVIHSTPYTMPALAQDHWWKPEVSTGLTEDRWIRGIEIRPTTVPGRRITHHALARLQQEEEDEALGAASDIGPGLLMEWAVGKQGEIMRPNSGKLIKAGSSIVWDIHYHAVGEQITDTVELGLYLYPKGEEPKFRQVLAAFSTFEGGREALSILPNQVTVTEAFHVMKQNGRIENFQPHLQLRGRGMQMEAILPDGERRVLSLVSKFDFNWHNNYVYADDAAPLLPKGTVLAFKAWYDNTAGLRGNPDPNQWVGWGDRTVDEMGHAWVNVTYLDDADFEAATAERAATLETATDEE
ncbi:MAG TPA: hypothetical protein EYQ83_01225 [Acidobacteria bacterium]|nr:hypothetical protein [Acidobacteriota bacterium]